MIDIKEDKRLNGYASITYRCPSCNYEHLVTMRHGKILHSPLLVENCEKCSEYIGDIMGLILKGSYAKKEYHVAGLHIRGASC